MCYLCPKCGRPVKNDGTYDVLDENGEDRKRPQFKCDTDGIGYVRVKEEWHRVVQITRKIM